jgi:hypothetical protein
LLNAELLRTLSRASSEDSILLGTWVHKAKRRAAGPKSREELSKNREPGMLLVYGISSVSINIVALLLRTGQWEKPLLYGRLYQEGS